MSRHCPCLWRAAKSPRHLLPPLFRLSLFCIALLCVGLLESELEAQDGAAKLADKSSNDAIARYSDGTVTFNQQQWAAAAKDFNGLLKNHPQDPLVPGALHYLGICQLHLQEHDVAVATFDRLITRFPKFELLDQTYFYFGFAHYRLGEAGKKASLKKAAATFSHLTKTYPKSAQVPRALYYQAEALLAADKVVEAVAPYQQLLADHPKHALVADAMYGLGWTHESLEQYDAAGAIYDRFLKNFPQHELVPDIKMQKGETLLAQGKFQEAAPWFQAALNTEGFALAGHALFQLATCAFEQKDFKKAANDYLAVVKDYPKSDDAPLAAMNGGKALVLLNQQPEARAALSPLVAAGGEIAAEASHLIARCYLKEKNPAAALKLLTKQIPAAAGGKWEAKLLMDRADATYEIADRRSEAVDLYAQLALRFTDDPLAAEALYMASFAAFQVGQLNMVLELADHFEQTFTEHKLLSDVRYNAAEAQLVLEQFDKAEAQLRKLIRSDTKHRDLALWKKRLGYALYLQEKSQAAIDQLSPLVAETKKPESRAEVQYWLGACYQQLKQYDKGAVAYAKSLETAPKFRQADRVLIGLAECQSQQNNLTEAIVTVKKMIAEFPKSTRLPAAHYRLGTYLAKSKQDDASTASFTKVVDTWPASAYAPYAMHGLGLAQSRSQQYAKAVASFSTLMAKHPKHNLANDSLFDRGQAYQAMGKFQLAIDDLTKYLASNPSLARRSAARHVLGICQDRLKKPANAVKTFRALLADDTQYAATDGVLYELGWSLKSINTEASRNEAVSTFAKLVANFPQSRFAQESHTTLGGHYYDNKQYEKAVASYNEAVKNLPQDASGEKTVYFLGRANFQLKAYDKAQKAFEQQISGWPDGAMVADAHYFLGEALFQQQKYELALDAYKKANAKKPSGKYRPILVLLRTGQCAAQLKQWKASLLPLETLIEKYPTSYYVADALYEAGWSKRKMADAAAATAGQEQQASAWYAEAVERFDSAARKAASRDAAGRAVGARARFMSGEIHFLRKNRQAAIHSYILVAKGYPDADAKTKAWKAKASYSLGRLYSVMKLVEDARKWYQETIEIYPKSPEAAEAKLRLAELAPR